MKGEIAQLPKEERKECLAGMGLKESGLDRMIRAGCDLLGLITDFTPGEKEVRAWTITNDTKAPQAAGKIHTDFEKGFIRAAARHFDDLTKHKTEQAVKAAGLLRSERKEYVVKDGDIVLFWSNVQNRTFEERAKGLSKRTGFFRYTCTARPLRLKR